MGTRITIDIHYGNSQVTNDDRYRAEDAACAVLDAKNITPAAAYAEYQRQWELLDDEDGMTGGAVIWVAARRAADLALTLGWANVDGAACSISC